MRKVFNKLAIFLTTSSTILPLTACVFNFYINSATTAITKSFANQTSSIIKSLILGKEKNTDTSQTIQDILNSFPDPNIKNQTNNINLNTWDDFANSWGLNKKINTIGFNPKDYFVKSGEGTLTKQINTYKNLNNTLNQSKFILGINIADNNLLYNLIKSNPNIKDMITNFLNEIKKENSDDFPTDWKTAITLLKNITVGTDWKNPDKNAFSKNVINPLSSLLNYLIEGEWAFEKTTPANNTELKSFMDQWKDEDGKPYSQWNNNSNWSLSSNYYQNWNQTDYNFYRSGTLINYLFYKIGKDYQIKEPETTDKYKDRYLGDIINTYITILPPKLDTDKISKDIAQYLPHLLENPKYIILLIEAIIPIIKQWGLKMDDITKGVKHLIFGKENPTDTDNSSYNILDFLNNINYLLNHPSDLEIIIKNLIGWTTEGIGRSLLYDIKVIGLPLGNLMKEKGLIPINNKQEIIDTIMGFINTNEVRNSFKNILYIYEQWIKQYNNKNEWFDFDLTKLNNFLIKNNNSLIKIINQDIIPTLYKIITNPKKSTDIEDEYYELFELYKSIGGQIPDNPDEQPPIEFRTNSFLDIIKSNINNSNEPLGQISDILFGNSSKNTIGIFEFIINSNNRWINDNYTQFFDINNEFNAQITNLKMKTNIKDNIISDNLSYNFTYKINNNIYSFSIKCKSYNYQNSFTGTKDFYFTDIKLNNIK